MNSTTSTFCISGSQEIQVSRLQAPRPHYCRDAGSGVHRGYLYLLSEDSGDTAKFEWDVMPGLQAVPLHSMAQATGLSVAHCSFVRRGLRVPHRRHWIALVELGTEAVR
jgi:hypothetical protein